MITVHDFQTLARKLVDRHGEVALSFADQAVNELESIGEPERAEAWRALRSFVDDILSGRAKDGSLSIN